jgi:hypothetical protein
MEIRANLPQEMPHLQISGYVTLLLITLSLIVVQLWLINEIKNPKTLKDTFLASSTGISF